MDFELGTTFHADEANTHATIVYASANGFAVSRSLIRPIDRESFTNTEVAAALRSLANDIEGPANAQGQATEENQQPG